MQRFWHFSGRTNIIWVAMKMTNYPSRRLFFQKGKIFHNMIVLLDRMELVHPVLFMVAACLALGGISYLFPEKRALAFSFPVAALAVESAVILLGRRLEALHGPFGGPFFLYFVGHAAALVIALVLPVEVVWKHLVNGILQATLLITFLYGSMIEPFMLRLRVDKAVLGDGGGAALRVLVISDLHLERSGRREERALKLAREFSPDLVLWPGDVSNLSFVDDPVTLEHGRAFISELAGLAPTYISLGTPEVDDLSWVKKLVEGTGAVLLHNESAPFAVGEGKLELFAVTCDCGHDERDDRVRQVLSGADGAVSVIMCHTPDSIEAAAECGANLYVAGHTHGGQVRVPLLGAPYTASRYGDRYSGGLYRVGGTTLVVSRGVGLEGAGAPRVRFMCPPEVVGLELVLPGPGNRDQRS